jgi:hypothetical protein
LGNAIYNEKTMVFHWFNGRRKYDVEQNSLTKNLVAWSAMMTVLAGVIHLWIIPEHWAHAPAHGLFFLVVGIAQIIWGFALWHQPSKRLYYIGVLMAGWLIVLYGITRWLPAPFGHGPEGFDTISLVCKLCEALGMITLGILIFQGLLLNAGRFVAWRAITLIILVSFLAAFATYGVARAAEPIFPSLSAQVEEHHHDESAPEEHHHDESTATPEHEH